MSRKLFIAFALVLSFLFLSCDGSESPKFEYKERVLLDDLNPYGIAAVDGKMYVSSPQDSIVAHIDAELRIVERIKDFKEPRRLNVVGDQLVISVFKENRIAMKKGKETLYYPLVQSLDGPMAASFAKSKVAVADYNRHRIVYYKGSEDLSFGEEGSGTGQFKYPTDVQIFGNKIYVADNANNRIQTFDFDGSYVGSIGEGSGLKQASGLYVYSGGIVVCDRTGRQVIIFDHQGNVKQIIGDGFETPSDAVVIGDRLYVADEEGGFIAVLEL